MKAYWKSRRGPLIGLLLMAAVMAWATLELNAIPGSFQRVFLPGEQTAQTESASAKTNQYLREMMDERETMDAALAGACAPTTLYAVAQPASVALKDEGKSVSARVAGIDENYLSMEGFSLYGGRYFYPDEYLYGQKVALIDEQLAVALFQYAEPLSEEIKLGGQSYRIIGIVRDHKRVGDEMEYSAYVPYRSLIASSLGVTALVYEAAPVAGAGGWAAFESAVSGMGATGTTWSLVKERMNAAMPLRLLLCLAGGALAFFCIGWLNRRSGKTARGYQALLREKYAWQLMGWLLPRCLGLIAGYAACLYVLALLFTVLVAPVFTFPEWVPAILVEPKDIAAAFWNVWQKPAKVVELRTPEVLRARFFGQLTGWAAGFCAAFLGVLWGRARKEPDQSPDQSKERTEN